MYTWLTAHLKKMSITTRWILYFYLLLVIQMIFVGLLGSSWISAYLRDTYLNYMQVSNNGLLQQINYIRTYYEVQSEKVLSYKTLQDILVKNCNARPGFHVLDDELLVDNLLYDPADTVFMIIVQKNGIVYQPYSGRYVATTHDRIITAKAYLKSFESDGSNLWMAANENMMTKEKEPFLYLLRTLKSLDISNTVLGQLLIQIPMDSLDDIFTKVNMKSGEYFAIIDDQGYFIYHTGDTGMTGKKANDNMLSIIADNNNGNKIIKEGGESYTVSLSLYQGKGWNVVHVIPTRFISSNAATVRRFILLILLSSLLVLLPLLILLSRNLSNPIKRLNSVVEQFGNGDLTVREKINRMDEIGHLQVSFNKMAEDINNLLSKTMAENKQIRLLELNMLEYQINPHFLYNSLDSINWMAQVSGNKDIEDLVCALAKFLRVGLSKGKEYYKVSDELNHIRQYMLINKIRFKDCFEFEIHAEPDILDYLTIKIILQPIVENAIKHGINKKNTDGYIKVTAKKDGSSILFEVSDNGPGIEEVKLQAIRNLLTDHSEIDTDSENGFGMYNVNQRIWLYFGDEYGITLDSGTGTGTTVRIRVPVIQKQ